MKKWKVGVLGAGGRMGREIAAILSEEKTLQAYLGVDSSGEIQGFTKKAKSVKDPAAKDVDVWIDFSSPKALTELLNARPTAAVVSGTTGIDGKIKSHLKRQGARGPVLWSSNMSIGISLLMQAMKSFAHAHGFDFHIEEVHHRHKKDSPSGTALTLKESLEEVIGEKIPAPTSIRGGGVFGIHKVWALSPEESIVFEHTALNRTVFARGAVCAAKWIVNQPAGVYRMSDVFNE